mmetsp:Transcript_11244/g.34432  ORF Transcript_11244/g.34432 Transcript_11244/m.34432 type:complete len:652 (-) Transcript_11244:220-2175(-)
MSWSGMLSGGSIRNAYEGHEDFHATLQVIEMKLYPGKEGSPDRYKVKLSDGVNSITGMLATQLSTLVASGELQNLGIVQVTSFSVSFVKASRILVVVNLKVLAGTQPAIIGSPTDINSGVSHQSTAAQGAAAPAPTKAPPVQNTRPTAAMGGVTASAPTGDGNGAYPPGTATHGQQSAAPAPKPSIKPQFPGPNEPWKYGSSTAIAKVGGAQTGLSGQSHYFPIASINPYQNRWTIRGRVTQKGMLRKYQNQKGEGQVMSFEISDDSGSIKVASFRDVAERMDGLIEMGNTYSISKASVKQADKRYNRTTSDYEMMLGNESEVVHLPDDGSLPKIKYNFVKIADLERKSPNTYHDVLGIVRDVSEAVELTSRTTGDLLVKRTVTLVDDSHKAIGLTLWGDDAQKLVTSAEGNPVLLCRGVRRGDYQGISLDGVRSSSFELNPDLPESHALKGWYNASGHNESAKIISNAANDVGDDGERRLLAEMSEDNLRDVSGKGTYFASRVTLVLINTGRDLWYPACPQTNKKLTERDGKWVCDATGNMYDSCNYRYLLSVNVQDESGSHWMSAFDETAKVIIGRSAEEMQQLQQTNAAEFERIIAEPQLQKYVVKVRAKQDTWRDEVRIKYQLQRIEPVDFVKESRLLLDEIRRYIN